MPYQQSELRDFPVKDVEQLPIQEKDKIFSVGLVGVPKASFTDGSRTLRLDFGGGSHWTMIYDASGQPVGCEFDNVRFSRFEDKIWVYPSRMIH